ncbi:O-antigen ligase family protein [Mycolicibacterium frederiksbergense]|nr:O-antigen ligase family protein [Mycolicibacterium frederiksbergense]
MDGGSNDFLAEPTNPAESSERIPTLLGVLCVLIPILPAFAVPAGPLKSNGSPAKVIAVVLFGLAVLGFLLVRRTTPTRTLRPGVVIILIYFLVQLMVYGVGLTREDGAIVDANKTRAVIILIASVGVSLYILSRIRTMRQRDIVLGCLAIGLTFACLVGFLQAVSGIDLRFLFEPPGFVTNTDAENLELAIRFGSTRVDGTSQHPIEFSLLAAITVPLTIYFARNAARTGLRWGAVLACGLALVSMPAAGSRTGVVALGAALLVYMWNFKAVQIALTLIVGSAGVVLYSAAFQSEAQALWHAITGAEEDPSIQGRISDYAHVSQTFREHPIFGLGLGGAPPDVYGLLDNEWLRITVQGGIVGITAMIVLTAGGLFGISAALRGAQTRVEREQAYVLGSMFAAILSSSFTFDLLFYQQATLIFFILFGLLWCNFTVPPTYGSLPGRTSRHRVAGVPAGAEPGPLATLWRR